MNSDSRSLPGDSAGETPAPLPAGSRIGHYEIHAKLGAGGMGAVYEAMDTRLNRPVAIKVLTGGHASESAGHGVLAREAQAASALNHPNIVTVYEVGQEGDLEFISMERVAGTTLAKRIGGRPMEIREAVRLAVQVADALAAAHDSGIIHRDLKPGNVMVTPRGLAKVLDFGVAKRVPVAEEDISERPTITVDHQGRVCGTIAYMSPEQAQAKPVDARSDIFAFGCVLYEMVTGKRAFHEDGHLLTLAAVVGKEPAAVRGVNPKVPQELARIIEQCIRKSREERWQSMADVRMLLSQLGRDLDNPTERPAGGGRRWPGVVAAVVAGAAIASAGWWVIAGRRTPAAPPTVLRRVTTGTGLSAFPAISRDGNLLAFASDRGGEGNLDIWIQQVGARDPIRVTHDAADDSDPDLSPDGTRIVFRSERAGGGVYLVQALGGEELLLAPRGRNPRFSPDGRWIAYWEGQELGGYLPGSAQAFVVESGGGQPRQIGKDLAAGLYPVWSPGGDGLLLLGRGEGGVDWWVAKPEGGASKKTGALAQLRTQGMLKNAWQINITPIVWRNPGGVLFASGTADGGGPGDSGNLWEIGLSAAGELQGSIAQVTRGPGYHLQAAAAAGGDRDRLAFASLDWTPGVWESDVDADQGVVRGEMRLLTPQESYATAPSLSRDGKTLLFASKRFGKWGLRLRDLTTGKEMTLVAGGPQLGGAKLSGDGASVAYSVGPDIFSIARSGGSARKLCERCGDVMGVSFNGERISYEPLAQEDLTMYDVAQGRSVVLSPRMDQAMVLSGGEFSPDDNFIAFHSVATRSGTTRVWIARIDGKAPVPTSDWVAVTEGTSKDRDPVWSPSGNLLYFLSERDGFRCIWARRLDANRKPAGDAFAVQHFHSARRSLQRNPGGVAAMEYAVTPGKLTVTFAELTGNIWLAEKPR